MSTVWKINGKEVSYAEWKRRGAKHKAIFGDRCAEMLESQAPPGVVTNDTFMRGKKLGPTAEDMPPDEMERYAKIAAEAGVSTAGKFYFGKVATKPADPEAWCGSDSDVIAVAKRKKMRLEIKGKTYDFRDKYAEQEPEPYAVADDVVEKYTQQRIEEVDPKLADHPEQVARIRQQIREEITPSVI